MSASPSWYDVLDVDPTATPDEIRAAWKSGIAELDPTDRRFRLLNQAAEVLLDPDSRREYDEARQAERSAAAEPTVVEEPARRASRDRVADAPEPPPAGPGPASPGLVTGAGTPSSTTAGPLAGSAGVAILAALGAVLVALLVTCFILWRDLPPSAEDVAEATGDAQSAAEKAIVPILSYDYRSLDDDQARASTYMTDSYKKDDYDPLFQVIRDNAPGTKTIVSTEVVGSSVVRSGDDRVQVFLFINMPTLRSDVTEPVVYKNQVTVTMEKVGDEWLVDELDTQAAA